MMFSGAPSTIEDIAGLNIVLEDINDLETEVNDKIIEDEILSSKKREMYDQYCEYIVDTYKKLKKAEDLKVFQGRDEQERIQAGIRTLESVESKIQYALERSDALEESD
ncbi:hypothetical protein F4813DRAFT_398996 [Daldinia decipiens]|uniref:uncharacterized protein n=1 Tax=Daldinia decipiens TaxID=326647 RepID=UPI0020C5B067|nr:uncharacterized protein F4813DRAFT_398996 [Daldinia decipiens]KAI1654252.1 hypothetical protein F4813DRAFT_398996 [Daldinia decipiens]